MIKKIIIVSIVATILITVGIVGFKYLKEKGVVVETGAVIIKPDQSELIPYDQMYALLDKGIISQDDFEIQPIKQKRIFNVKLKSPADLSKIKFEAWLKENNYDKIPKEKFLFVN